jgi:hypothetical protein
MHTCARACAHIACTQNIYSPRNVSWPVEGSLQIWRRSVEKCGNVWPDRHTHTDIPQFIVRLPKGYLKMRCGDLTLNFIYLVETYLLIYHTSYCKWIWHDWKSSAKGQSNRIWYLITPLHVTLHWMSDLVRRNVHCIMHILYCACAETRNNRPLKNMIYI